MDFWPIMYATVYFVHINLTHFPCRIKFTARKDQKAVINFYKNRNTWTTTKEKKAALETMSSDFSERHCSTQIHCLLLWQTLHSSLWASSTCAFLLFVVLLLFANLLGLLLSNWPNLFWRLIALDKIPKPFLTKLH